MRRSSLLGEYLRSRRERITPTDAGLEVVGPRRVPGLRREEVALLAGISANYYLRLEQGRDRSPSEQVLEALARALRLDTAESAHLLALGRTRVTTKDGPRKAAVPASILQLLRALDLPAWVQDEHFDVHASNAMARALSPTLRAGRNRMLSVFLDPDERALFTDWSTVAAHLVASFRASVAGAADDSRTTQLVAELSTRNPAFRELWSGHDVVAMVDRPPVRFTHPVIGPFTLSRENLVIDGPDPLRLMMYHAEPGSTSSSALDRLRTDVSDR